MRVIPVLDIKNGMAVHARAGRRAEYQPVRSRLVAGAGDAVALARAFREQLSLEELYVADLDAIEGATPQWSLVRSLASGGTLVLDAGIADPETARRAAEAGATRVVIGLETLPSFDVLAEIVRTIGSHRTVFSLDLRDGRPIILEGAPHAGDTAISLAERAVESGAGAIIILDLARVGTSCGPDLEMVRAIRQGGGRVPPGRMEAGSVEPPGSMELLAGGGVRSRADLERLADHGCDGALVATALHDGRLREDDIEALKRWPHAPVSR